MNQMVDPKTLTISASAFKAGCLALMDDLKSGRLDKVIVTKRGKPIAELRKLEPVVRPALHGLLKHMFVSLPSDEDLMAPAFDGLWDAEKDGPLGGMDEPNTAR